MWIVHFYFLSIFKKSVLFSKTKNGTETAPCRICSLYEAYLGLARFCFGMRTSNKALMRFAFELVSRSITEQRPNRHFLSL
jgi:hypothetical protein